MGELFSKQSYIERRERLQKMVQGGVILLLGNDLTPFNYKNNAYAFRQDSTFRYFFGVNKPGVVGVIDIEAGESHLFGDDFTVEDIIWTGVQPTLSEMGAEVGVGKTHPMGELAQYISRAKNEGRKIHFLPPYRADKKMQLSDLVGVPFSALAANISTDLLFAVAEMREVKSTEEVAAIEDAIKIGYLMHTTAMGMCREGLCEREIAGIMEGVARSQGAGTSFPTIASQHGETLHNINQNGILENGRLFLCDAGVEALNGYVSDHTRTYPVSGKFTPLQRDIYNIVLKAQQHVSKVAAPMQYMELQREAQLVLSEGFIDMGLMNGTAQDAVDSGAISLFMPHGLSHGMGMDVHDCEAIGERSFDFAPYAERAAQSATCVHRATWRLRPGAVISNEPGIYFIPALINSKRQNGEYQGVVNYSKLESLYNFGGIRIEDDLLITENGCRILGEKQLPITVEEIEAFMTAARVNK